MSDFVPSQILAIYDNGGETADRYSVYLTEKWDKDGVYNTVLGLSSNPESPMGFSEFSGGMPGNPGDGKKIEWADLPENIRQHIHYRLSRWYPNMLHASSP